MEELVRVGQLYERRRKVAEERTLPHAGHHREPLAAVAETKPAGLSVRRRCAPRALAGRDPRLTCPLGHVLFGSFRFFRFVFFLFVYLLVVASCDTREPHGRVRLLFVV